MDEVLAPVSRKHGLSPDLLAALLALERASRRHRINQRFEELLRDGGKSGASGVLGGSLAVHEAGEALGDRGGFRIRSLELANFSLFAHVRLDCPFDPERPLSVVEGGNGHGKSTLLRGLQFILYGAPSLGDGELLRLMHAHQTGMKGRMEGSLRLVGAQGGEALIKRFFDLERSADGWSVLARSLVVRPAGEAEPLHDRDAQQWIDDHLPREILSYFVFDSESSPVAALADDDGRGAEVADKLEAVLGITHVRRAAQRVRDVASKLAGQLEGDTVRRSPRQVKAEIEQVEADLERRDSALADLGRELAEADKNREKLLASERKLLAMFDPQEDVARAQRIVRRQQIEAEIERTTEALGQSVGSGVPIRLVADRLAAVVAARRASPDGPSDAARMGGA